MNYSDMIGIKLGGERIENYDLLNKIYYLDNTIFELEKHNKKIYKNTKIHKDLLGYCTNTCINLMFKDKDLMIKSDNEEVQNFINGLIYKNNLDISKTDYLKDYVLLGDLFFKIEDSEDNGIDIVYIDCYYVKELEKDTKGNIIKICIQYPISETNEKGDIVTSYYDEIYTLDKFEIYKDNNLIEEKENPYNFVPFIHFCSRKSKNDNFGESIYLNKINLIKQNAEAYSLALDTLKFNIDPKQTLSGTKNALQQFKVMNGGNNVNLSEGKNTLVLPDGVTLQQLNSNGIDSSYIQLLEIISTSIKEDLEEYCLENAKGQTSAIALELILFPLQAKIKTLNNNFKSSFNLLVDYCLRIANEKGILNIDIDNTEWDLEMGVFFNTEEDARFEKLQKETERVVGLYEKGILTKKQLKDKLEEIEIKYK